MADVLVLGAGPAGTALASALTQRGVATTLVDPEPRRAWPNRYGAWSDELDALGLSHVAARTWPRSELVLPDGRLVELDRGYASVDGQALRAALHDRAGATIPTVEGRARDVEPGGDRTRLVLADGRTLETRLVVDATGHRSRFVQRAGPPPAAWQIAWGIEYRDVEVPYATDAMRFMDWRPPRPDDPDPTPTFLYAMPIGPGRWFFEETQLIGPLVELGQLERRLGERLSGDGVRGAPDGGVERCCFPMDPPLPVLDQPVLGFGAAASLVHPATGYLLMRTLRAAPRVADALAEGIEAARPPLTLARDAWRTLWPPELVDAARLLRFGAAALQSMDRAELGVFYEAFFSIDERSWRAYLAGDRPAGDLARVMLEVFAAAGLSTRLRLASRGLGDPWPLLRGLTRMWI